MTEENKIFFRRLLVILLPVTIQNFMLSAVSVSDAIMISLLDQDSLSAVSLAGQSQFVLGLFLGGLSIGGTILAAQYWGKKDQQAVEQVLAIALRGSIGVSVVFFLLSFFAPEVIMKIYTHDAHLISLGSLYLRTVAPAYLCLGFCQIYLGIMKTTDKVLKSTIYSTVAVFINLVLNALLIFGLLGFPRLGLRGAALATLVARLIEFILVFGESFRKEAVQVRLSYLLRPSQTLVKDFIHYTSPAFINMMVWGVGFSVFSVILGHLGSDAVAANSIGNIVKNLTSCVCLGIGSGTGIMVGQVLGTGDLELARRYGDKFLRLSEVVGIMTGILILVLRPSIVNMASTLTPQAKEYLSGMLIICAYYVFGEAINGTVITGVFTAGGYTRFGVICDFITMWMIVLPLAAIAAFVLHAPIMVVYFILNLFEVIKLPVVYRYYRKYHWVKNLTREVI